MFPAIQIAVYMGFNPLYLIGCDLNYRSDTERDLNHAAPYIRPANGDAAANNPVHIQAHEISLAACKARGVEIYNATEGGALDVYERVDLMELLNAD